MLCYEVELYILMRPNGTALSPSIRLNRGDYFLSVFNPEMYLYHRKDYYVMEKFIHELTTKLLKKFPRNDVVTITQLIYGMLLNYDVVPRKNEIVAYENELPKELMLYLAMRKIEGLQDSSINQYHRELTRMLRFIDKPIKKISTEDIRYYLYTLQTKRMLSNRTLDIRRSYISAFFSWLTNNEYLVRNPCASIAPVKFEEPIKDYFTDVEMEKLRMACANDYERAVVEVLYASACRVAELVNIKLEDINFEEKEVNIHHGKGDKSRKVFLTAKAVVTVQQYIKDRDYPTVYLFESCRKPHQQLSTRSIECLCQRLGEQTGIKCHPHKFRRTMATVLHKKGMPAENIKEILGHSEISTTLGYTVIDKQQLKSDYQKYL